MAQYKDANPNSGASAGGRKSERAGGGKNNDGRLKGGSYDKQDNSASDGLPQRTASRNSKKTYDPNEDAPNINGGTAYNGKRRTGLEEGAY